MKWLLPVLAIGVWAWAAQPEDQPYTVLISGPAEGYLSPCGCVQPMMGGIRRKATAVRELGTPKSTLLLEVGPFSHGRHRQDELKAEAYAEALGRIQPSVIGLTASDSILGPAMIAGVQRLSKGALISGSVTNSPVDLVPIRHEGPFAITAIDPEAQLAAQRLGGQVVSERQALAALRMDAQNEGLAPILITSGNEEEARRLAEENSWLKLIVYSRDSQAVREMVKVGDVVIAAAGEKGKTLLRLVWRGERFTTLTAHDLGPGFADDEATSRTFRTYKDRVADEKLIELVPRTDGEKYGGNAKCMSCHTAAGEVWKHSEHAHALKTLEDDHSDRDPECVGCHVVGLDKVQGFKSREITPNLTDVGCESCHGAGEAHIKWPKKNPMPKVGAASCMPCHNSEHSPEFDFEKYWPRIAH